MAEKFSSRHLFRGLDGRTYSDYAELEAEVLGVFEKKLTSFPTHFTGHKLLALGESKGWIVPGRGKSFRIDYVADD